MESVTANEVKKLEKQLCLLLCDLTIGILI